MNIDMNHRVVLCCTDYNIKRINIIININTNSSGTDIRHSQAVTTLVADDQLLLRDVTRCILCTFA